MTNEPPAPPEPEPDLPAPDPIERAVPDERALYVAIANSVRRVVNATIKARRDVHAKHHGCVLAELHTEPLPSELCHGVFAKAGVSFKAWVRFSNGNKRPQPDSIGDSRGMAIKLIETVGPRLVEDGRTTQDFLCSTYPAFFVRDARDMVEVAKLEAADEFPSSFFAEPQRFAGLAALLGATSIKAVSPVALEYYSQTPYRLGPELVVKLRLRPVRETSAALGKEVKDDNYLYRALKQRLDPSQQGARPVVFELQAQPRLGDEPIDDATMPWRGPFVTLAQLQIPLQQFDSTERMAFAEHIAFNPWNGLVAHRPLGTLNRARFLAYRASSRLRHGLNNVAEPQYTQAEWERLKNAPPGERWTPPPLPQIGPGLRGFKTAVALFPRVFEELAKGLGTRWGYALSLGALVITMAVAHCKPSWFVKPLSFGVGLPSEAWIPPAKYSQAYAASSFARDERVRRKDLTWAFRYLPTGSEFDGGLPYWVFRALPRMFPEKFDGRSDWTKFGLRSADDHTYYDDYHGLPRGAVLSDTTITILSNRVGVTLKRVSFNCATCHRGEYTDQNGVSQFMDGMPNVGIDTAGYKRVTFEVLNDTSFTLERLATTINTLLAEDHRTYKHVGEPPTLSGRDLLAYSVIVKRLQSVATEKSLAWMDDEKIRPKNGPGRLDAFGALRFEILGRESAGDNTVATVDLPSIWHQSPDWRPFHHYDGNTADAHARNFGAIVGVGGRSFSIDRALTDDLGQWIEHDLEPRPYPFKPADPALVKAGQEIYEARCADCHGKYDKRKLQGITECMQAPLSPSLIKTDPKRAEAADEQFVFDLNNLGARLGLWPSHAFQSTGGYLCPPLDGIWARAPYLHNGSVPTLADLLSPDPRPALFERGNPDYDTVNAGFVSNAQTPPHDRRKTFTFNTKLVGNSNLGHDDKNQVLENVDERRQVIAYLLTL